MQELGTVKGSRIEKNRDSDTESRVLTTQISSPEDNQSVELIKESGTDINPEDNDVVLVLKIGNAYKLGIVIDDQIAPDVSLEKGEKEIFSKLNGAKLAKIKLNKDGEIVLNDGTDFAVAYTELKSQIDQLRTQLNSHAHTGVTAGGGVSGPTQTPFTVDVTNTKVDKVRL